MERQPIIGSGSFPELEFSPSIISAFFVSQFPAQYQQLQAVDDDDDDDGDGDESATSFLYDLGWRISLVSREDREPQFLFQRISVAIQHFNAVLLHNGFLLSDHPD